MIELIFIGFLTSITLTASSADIIEPCELDDYECISYVLSINSACDTSVWGSVPSEVGFVDYEFQGAYFNATYFDQYAIFKNLGKCKVSAFFFNLNSNVAVLAIDCPNLVLQARRALIQHQDLGQDRYFAYQITQRFLPISMTVNLRPADRIDLCDSIVFTYLEGIPKYEVNPDDAATAEFLSSAENDMPRRQDIFVREEMRYYGQQLFKLFVNYILCDFRLGCTE